MILWLIFVGVLVASYLLALRSMRDFQEIPGEDEDYSLFLIRRPQELNFSTLSLLRDNFLKSGQVLSFERLFKGYKSALVIFGPRRLTAVLKTLDLLELEDYTQVSPEQVNAWEVGIKESIKSNPLTSVRFPQLNESEQLWWQLLVSRSFKPQIRAVLVVQDPKRRKDLSSLVENLSPDRLIRLPRGFTNSELLDFYQKRSFKKDNGNPPLSLEEVLSLVKI